MRLNIVVVWLAIFVSGCAARVGLASTGTPTARLESQVSTIENLAEVTLLINSGGKVRTLLVLDL